MTTRDGQSLPPSKREMVAWINPTCLAEEYACKLHNLRITIHEALSIMNSKYKRQDQYDARPRGWRYQERVVREMIRLGS